MRGSERTTHVFLHGSDNIHLTIQLSRSEKNRFSFDFKDLVWELRRTARGPWY